MCGKAMPPKVPGAAALLDNLRCAIVIVRLPDRKTKKALPMRAHASIGRALLPDFRMAALLPPVSTFEDYSGTL
jgi:hypothetical protein